MKSIKKIIIIFSVLVMFSMGVTAFASIEEDLEEHRSSDSVQRVILIDPGHGGNDGGARSVDGTLEKDINLEVSKKLRDELKERGYLVHMTREDDIALHTKKKDDLYLRCKKKREVKSLAFISIHQNKFPKPECKGTQVWYSSNKKSKCIAEKIQMKIKEKVQKENERKPKDAKKAYRILRDGNSEANIIVECGFLSNEEDEKNIKDEEYQKNFVKAISDGVDEYFKKSF